jgi:uncharacterized protein (TIGR02246 family)
MHTVRTAAGLVLVAILSSVSAGAQQPGGTEREVLQAQADRNKAVLAQDMKSLEPLLATELTWVHSSARIQNKTEYLEMVRSGASRWLKLDPQGMKVRLYGDTAVVTGELHQTTTGPGRQPADRTLHTIEVYVKRNGRWLLTDCQATAVPETKPSGAI